MVDALEQDEVHVWRIDLDRHGDAAAKLLPLLGETERRTAERFRLALHGRRYVLAHAATRCILARYLGTTPRALRLRSTPAGRPEAIGDGLEYSSSRSHGLALCAISRRGPIGVDVERTRAHVETAMAPGLDGAAFTRAWTRVEAAVKAGAFDLDAGVECLEACLKSGRVVLPVSESGGAERAWWFEDLTPAEGYVAAVATQDARPGWRLLETDFRES